MVDNDAYIVNITEIAVPNQYESPTKKELLFDLVGIDESDSRRINFRENSSGLSKKKGSLKSVGEFELENNLGEGSNDYKFLKNFSFFGGKVVRKPKISYFNDLELEDQVLVFAPLNRKHNILIQPNTNGRKFIVPEKYIFPLPKNLNLKEAVLAASSSTFIVNALFE